MVAVPNLSAAGQPSSGGVIIINSAANRESLSAKIVIAIIGATAARPAHRPDTNNGTLRCLIALLTLILASLLL